MFYRKIYDRMKAWKEKADGRTALLIEGARRVGKSTVAKAFAENEYAHVLLIDFSTASPDVVRLFDDLSDLDTFFLQLQLFCHVSLEQRKSVIIFDEVQFCPRARQAIKHLVADRRSAYTETGSLISIRKNVKVNGKRRPAEFMIEEGDVVALYMSDKDLDRFHTGKHMGGLPAFVDEKAGPPIDIRYQD